MLFKKKEEPIEIIYDYNFETKFTYPTRREAEEILKIEIDKFLNDKSETHDVSSDSTWLKGKIASVLNDIYKGVEEEKLDLVEKVKCASQKNELYHGRCLEEINKIEREIVEIKEKIDKKSNSKARENAKVGQE